jgi:hypothetical protein
MHTTEHGEQQQQRKRELSPFQQVYFSAAIFPFILFSFYLLLLQSPFGLSSSFVPAHRNAFFFFFS